MLPQEISDQMLDTWLFPFVHLYTARLMVKVQDLGLHPAQIPALMAIDANEGCTLREVASLLHLKPPTVTVTVQRLEKLEFLEKKGDEKDQRIYHLFLTPQGKAVLEKAVSLARENHEVAIKGVSPQEVESFKKCLLHMQQNLKEDAGGEVPPPGPYCS